MAKTKTATETPEALEQEAPPAAPDEAAQPQPEAAQPAAEAQQAHDAEFARLDAQARPEGKASLEMILDLELRVTAELGRAELMIRDLLQLGAGSVIELDKTVGEPVDVLVNDRLLARGEVVVIDDSFGVRITEIVTPVERVQSLCSPEVEQS